MSLAVLCPGQGGQHAAMFARVADAPAAASVLAAASKVLGAAAHTLAADNARYTNAIAQPLVCAGTLAHWQLLRAQLPTPVLVLGYSVGELAAHAVAGSMEIDTCLQLASTRARLMDAASPDHAGLMAVLGLPAAHAGGAVSDAWRGHRHRQWRRPCRARWPARCAAGTGRCSAGAGRTRHAVAGERASAYALAACGGRCLRG